MLSGCAIIVRGQPRGGPPPERQINLSNIRAGNLARRAAATQPDAKDTPDEVGAFPHEPVDPGDGPVSSLTAHLVYFLFCIFEYFYVTGLVIDPQWHTSVCAFTAFNPSNPPSLFLIYCPISLEPFQVYQPFQVYPLSLRTG